MTGPNNWQEKLDKTLADNPASPDTQVLSRLYGRENAEDIESALSIEQHLDQIGLQQVPDALQEKLRAIATDKHPAAQAANNNKVVKFPRQRTWFTMGAIAAAVGIMSLVNPLWHNESNIDRQPSLAEINQAKRDLALAFNYLSKANASATTHIENTLNSNVQRPVIKGVALQLDRLRGS